MKVSYGFGRSSLRIIIYSCSYENGTCLSSDPYFRPLDIDIGTCTAAESWTVSDGAFSINTEELK